MDKTGGPAFPVLELNPVSGNIQAQHLGITRRDYFAAHALAGLTGGENTWPSNVKSYAEKAYELADAMLAARGEAGNG